MRDVTLAVTQFACAGERAANLDTAERLVRESAAQGAQVILLQELFAGPYFCKEQKVEFFALAETRKHSMVVQRFSALAGELGVVLPISFFERDGNAHFNTVAVADADARVLGYYRKSHIPDGPCYQEKFYFSPGDTGFRVWDTAYARLGVGICWDQWFPEAARSMALQGAEVLLYPTAIGSDDTDVDSQAHWQTAMRGHAAVNFTPVAASNRIGREVAKDGTAVTFYGSSFLCDWQGRIVAAADRTSAGVRCASFDLDAIHAHRLGWGMFRDRRPDLYAGLVKLGGA